MDIIFEELIEDMFRRMGKLKYLYWSILRLSILREELVLWTHMVITTCKNIWNIISLLKDFIILVIQPILFLIE